MERFNNTLKYSLYGAALSFVVLILLLVSGNSPWSSASWMGCWIPGVTAYFVLKLNAEENPEAAISFYQAFKQSMNVIFFQASFFTIISILFTSIFDTGALEMYRAEMVQNAEQLALLMGEEMYDQVINELENISYFTLAFWDFIYKLFGGAIVSLILAGIFKKNKPIFENE